MHRESVAGQRRRFVMKAAGRRIYSIRAAARLTRISTQRGNAADDSVLSLAQYLSNLSFSSPTATGVLLLLLLFRPLAQSCML